MGILNKDKEVDAKLRNRLVALLVGRTIFLQRIINFLLHEYEENLLEASKIDGSKSMEIVVMSEESVGRNAEDKRIKRNKRNRRPLCEINENQRSSNTKALKARQEGWRKQGGMQKRCPDSRGEWKQRRLSDIEKV
jgi:hypothetical protein